jgi:hypothetical protein
MTDVSTIASYLAVIGGIGAAMVVSVAAVLLHRRNRSGPTLALLGGMVVLWVGSAVQLLAPLGAVSYVSENDELIGAGGTFSTVWYVGSIIFYSGLLVAAAGFLAHTLSSRGRANDA